MKSENVKNTVVLIGFTTEKIEKPISQKSIRSVMSSIKIFHNFLFLSNFTKIDPSSNIELPKVNKKIPDYLNVEEIESIFNNISIVFRNSEFKKRNLAIVNLLYGCGLRASEVCEIKINNIYFIPLLISYRNII